MSTAADNPFTVITEQKHSSFNRSVALQPVHCWCSVLYARGHMQNLKTFTTDTDAALHRVDTEPCITL